jgi:asparagine synthase (glutamine-hydrolysing)
MCGIAGIVAMRGPGPDRETLDRMAGALDHRGPDERGIYHDRRAGLAHARLSIIDLATGQQPLCNEDETLWIVFNGEIFNYIELRAELIGLGHRFATGSDTEVIVHAWEEWNEAAFLRFNGQFAVALWDARRARLVLARDRFGVRPLYICEHAGRLHFASEVKAIFAADRTIPRAFDPGGLDQTLTFWSVVPPQSIFAGIEELRPGCVRIYDLDPATVRESAFWAPTYPVDGEGGFAGTLDDAVDAVRVALTRATDLRLLRADVPVGSYLSGGLDSSVVAALAAVAKAPGRLSTFSLRFEDAEYDETEFQRLMVARLGSEHREVVVSRRDIARVFPEVVAAAERPLLRTAPAPMFLLSKLVREAGIKVVLTGEGADEMFGGYDLFREAKVRRFWARQPLSKLRPRLLERLYPYLARSPIAQQAMARQFFGQGLSAANEPGFSHDLRWRTTSSLKRLLSADVRAATAGRDARAEFLSTLPPVFGRWTSLAQDQYLEVKTLLSAYLLSSQGDRMLMANSVEGRFPFLDVDLVRLADSLPPAYKLRVMSEKHVLKKMARDLVPEAIVARKKQPYRAPDALAFLGEDAPDWIEACLSGDAIRDASVFDARQVQQLWRKCQEKGADRQFSNADNMAVVGVLSTQLLHEKMIRTVPSSNVRAPRTLVERT